METSENLWCRYVIRTHWPVDQNQVGFSNLFLCKDALHGSFGKVPLSWHGRRNQRDFRQPAKPYAFNFVIRVNRIPGRKSTLRRVRISHEMPNDGSLETEVNYGYGPIIFCNFHGKVAGEKGFDSGGRRHAAKYWKQQWRNRGRGGGMRDCFRRMIGFSGRKEQRGYFFQPPCRSIPFMHRRRFHSIADSPPVPAIHIQTPNSAQEVRELFLCWQGPRPSFHRSHTCTDTVRAEGEHFFAIVRVRKD